MAHPDCHVLFRELKTDQGRLSEDQREWLALLTGGGLDAGVWRPSDWDRVVRELDVENRVWE